MAIAQTVLEQVGFGVGLKNEVSAQDREVLRRLAGKVAHIAARPIEQEKRELWIKHNALEETRPLIFCDPEGGWKEIIREEDLECRGELARMWENRLRKEIFWAEGLKDDRVIEPAFAVSHVYCESTWGLKETKIGGENRGSYIWDAPIKTWDDLEKLQFPTITVDHEATRERVELAKSAFGDLLQVRLWTSWWWTQGLTIVAAKLRGLEQLMLDMYDSPEEFKRFMAFLRDGHAAKMEFLESERLLGGNTGNQYVGSGGFGFTREIGGGDASGVKLRDMWGFCESQETTGIGPEMFAEFVFPFQVPLMEKFGLNCYGCCEPLHLRWDVVKQAPRLRRVSVSPWADVEKMAEQLQNKYVYSYKPSPSDLAMPQMDEDAARSRLRKLRQGTKGCVVEAIMKDNHTLGGGPRNAVRWVELAREELGE